MDGGMDGPFFMCISGPESNLGPPCYEATVLSAFYFFSILLQHSTRIHRRAHTRAQRGHISLRHTTAANPETPICQYAASSLSMCRLLRLNRGAFE